MYFVIDCRGSQYKVLSITSSPEDARTQRNHALEEDGRDWSLVIIAQAI